MSTVTTFLTRLVADCTKDMEQFHENVRNEELSRLSAPLPSSIKQDSASVRTSGPPAAVLEDMWHNLCEVAKRGRSPKLVFPQGAATTTPGSTSKAPHTLRVEARSTSKILSRIETIMKGKENGSETQFQRLRGNRFRKSMMPGHDMSWHLYDSLAAPLCFASFT